MDSSPWGLSGQPPELPKGASSSRHVVQRGEGSMADSSVLSAPADTARRTRTSWWRRIPGFVYPLVAIAIALAMWEVICGAFKVPLYILPPPSKIVVGVFANGGLLLNHS